MSEHLGQPESGGQSPPASQVSLIYAAICIIVTRDFVTSVTDWCNLVVGTMNTVSDM